MIIIQVLVVQEKVLEARKMFNIYYTAVIALCNIMKSYDQSRDGSNPIETISYLPKVDLLLVIRYLTYLIFSVNLQDQLFESTYSINLH